MIRYVESESPVVRNKSCTWLKYSVKNKSAGLKANRYSPKLVTHHARPQTGSEDTSSLAKPPEVSVKERETEAFWNDSQISVQSSLGVDH